MGFFNKQGKARGADGIRGGVYGALRTIDGGPVTPTAQTADGKVPTGFVYFGEFDGGITDGSSASRTIKTGWPARKKLRSSVTDASAKFSGNLAVRSALAYLIAYGEEPTDDLVAANTGTSVYLQLIIIADNGDDMEWIIVPDAELYRDGDIAYNDEDLILTPTAIEATRTTLTHKSKERTGDYFIALPSGLFTEKFFGTPAAPAATGTSGSGTSGS